MSNKGGNFYEQGEGEMEDGEVALGLGSSVLVHLARPLLHPTHLGLVLEPL